MPQLIATSGAFDSWIACCEPRPQARLRLFCFPYAGSGASVFRTWPGGLPTDFEVCPVQLPGRGTRLMERPFSQLSPLVQALTQALSPLLDKPFAFFGHSLGSLVSFELARELRRQYGVYPVRLFVSSGHAPQIAHRGLPIHTLPEREFLAELHRLNGTPTEVLAHQELMEIMLPVLRADFALYENYVYAPDSPLDCPISAFGGLQDHRVSHSDLEAWRDQTSVSFSLRMFPGDHFFLNTTPSLLLQVLSRELQ
jgi:medium-chain acyl-[acyl-carrier-protein] hydrolase